MIKKTSFQKISLGKIGAGKFYTAGSLTARKNVGLAGALKHARRTGYLSGKNLSEKDLKTFQGLIGKELSSLSTHSKGLSYKARQRIMNNAEKLRIKGAISGADKKDLGEIVKALGIKSKQGITAKTLSDTQRQEFKEKRAKIYAQEYIADTVDDELRQGRGEISELHVPTKIAGITLKNQGVQEKLAKKATAEKQEIEEKLAKDNRTKKFIASYLAEELAEERAELLGKIGGRKSPKLTLSEELEKEQGNREKKVAEEKAKREKLIAPLEGKMPIPKKSISEKIPPDIFAGL